mmetsp:Transcript_13277/g.28691  ORF Transcript_13277/g.28691 Transcript_13277/m.28691 type:complete len:260 (-) Transcript_13277:90-869(-)
MPNPFLERTSVQVLLAVVVVAFMCNAATSHTDEGLPWEVTLGGMCVFGIVLGSYYIRRADLALSIVGILAAAVPTYFVSNAEVPCVNFDLGSMHQMAATKEQVLSGIWRGSTNLSRFDAVLPLDLSLYDLSLFPPSISLTANTSEIYHSGLKLDDKVTGERTHEYLLVNSPRKVRRKTVAITLLAKVPYHFDVWPKEESDYAFDLQTAAHIVAPPTFTGELLPLDKGPAIVSLQNKYNLRPFLLNVYRVDYLYGSRGQM